MNCEALHTLCEQSNKYVNVLVAVKKTDSQWFIVEDGLTVLVAKTRKNSLIEKVFLIYLNSEGIFFFL